MQQLPLACFLSLIRPPGVSFEDGYLQILPVDKAKCPFVRDHTDITFRLYTRHNPIMFQELKIDDDESLFASHMDFHDPTVVYFSAFLEQPDDGSGLQVREWKACAPAVGTLIDYYGYGFIPNTKVVKKPMMERAHPELKTDDDESLFASHMDFHDPTVVYFSAFLEQPDDGSGLQVRESYMLRGDTNFIILDLSRLEAGPWYFTAAENTWYIGNFAAKFIDYLVSRGLDLKKTHLVGHSLGAQSAGVAGSVLKSGRVSRITGLDPAFPLFDKLPLSQRLDPSDADFVDVIHTDAGIFGFNRPTGHVDFYPNGGISPQPGCELEVVLHEQRLLNKCEGDAQPHGLYKFTLDTNEKTPNLEDKLRKYFSHINEIKENGNQNIETSNKKEYTENKPTEKKHAFTKYHKKNKEIKTTANFVTKHTTTEINKPQNYRREKRISTNEENQNAKHIIDIQTNKRTKRFISFFNNDDNFLFKMLDFLVKNRKNVLPVVTVMREINTLVKNANGELSHISKERNNYIGAPPQLIPIAVDLEIGNESKVTAFVKRLLGLGSKGGKLSING